MSDAWWVATVGSSVAVLGSDAAVDRAAAATPGTGDGVLGIAIIAGMAVSAGLLVAWIAATQRLDDHEGVATDWLAVAVGPLLSSLGAVAMLTAAGENPGVAGVAAAFGTILAWVVVGVAGRSDRAALGRRSVGGATLAAGYAAGSLVGLLGAAVLAGHVTVNAAVGRGDGWLRATGVTVSILGGCLGVTALGLWTLGLSPAGHVAALAFAGGSLLVVGLAETNLTGSSPWDRRVDAS
ncbi:hypothetical protein SAMN05216388_100358 [Halorientalis persicus]|uniref:Uncharacterized protein n=1 Tax=Halorientalis persicus TaxID=1367881 RepID=A0A1H8GBK1_9EURY|nr:hypothetical protein [Halorientalis persicus]SEN41521.1 hypothetical protein SAMN05216388_100358 [Halorientalis persicus]